MWKQPSRSVETGFFVFYFLILPFFSDVQYYLEYGDDLRSTLIFRLVTTPPVIAAYYFYYRRQAPLLLDKHYRRFVLSLLLFILFVEIYLHLLDWINWHLPLLSDQQRAQAGSNWTSLRFPRQSLWLTLTNLAAVTGFAFFMRRWKDERIMRELREQQLRMELDALRAQLQPHFFFNTLNNIYSLALFNSEKTAPMVACLAGLMRYIIYEGNKEFVSLQTEVSFLEEYVGLEKIRHNASTPISFSTQGLYDNIQVAPLLFIPLLENGFKHGFGDPLQNGWLRSTLHISDTEIVFDVKNSKGKKNGQGGIGLQNLRKRLQLLYPGRHRLEIKDGTEFQVTLTLLRT